MNPLKKTMKWFIFLALVSILVVYPIFAKGIAPVKKVKVVAAENFYGDIVKQLGGKLVDVTSILSDPNVDPKAYENVNNAKVIASADLVIENGGGYDDWMDKLLSASPNSKRILLKGFNIAPSKLPENEYIWYSVVNIQAIAQAITSNLKKLDPADGDIFSNNLQKFIEGLNQIRQKMAVIMEKYRGTPVGLTETFFLYQAGPLGLQVLTPYEFQKAVAEGNDPPADAIVATEKQITSKAIKVIIYNEQTVSKIITKLRNNAKAAKVTMAPVTETMPKNKNYQSWMLGQLDILEKALGR
jgi:zinc/manganese transport system substrate-binding protein